MALLAPILQCPPVMSTGQTPWDLRRTSTTTGESNLDVLRINTVLYTATRTVSSTKRISVERGDNDYH